MTLSTEDNVTNDFSQEHKYVKCGFILDYYRGNNDTQTVDMGHGEFESNAEISLDAGPGVCESLFGGGLGKEGVKR